MKIQFNTDKTVSGDHKQEEYFTSIIEKGVKRFESNITRIEVHLSDNNGEKKGSNDIECILEARLEGMKPIAVSCKANSPEAAVTGAVDKLKTSLDTILGRNKEHQK